MNFGQHITSQKYRNLSSIMSASLSTEALAKVEALNAGGNELKNWSSIIRQTGESNWGLICAALAISYISA